MKTSVKNNRLVATKSRIFSLKKAIVVLKKLEIGSFQQILFGCKINERAAFQCFFDQPEEFALQNSIFRVYIKQAFNMKWKKLQAIHFSVLQCQTKSKQQKQGSNKKKRERISFSILGLYVFYFSCLDLVQNNKM